MALNKIYLLPLLLFLGYLTIFFSKISQRRPPVKNHEMRRLCFCFCLEALWEDIWEHGGKQQADGELDQCTILTDTVGDRQNVRGSGIAPAGYMSMSKIYWAHESLVPRIIGSTCRVRIPLNRKLKILCENVPLCPPVTAHKTCRCAYGPKCPRNNLN